MDPDPALRARVEVALKVLEDLRNRLTSLRPESGKNPSHWLKRKFRTWRLSAIRNIRHYVSPEEAEEYSKVAYVIPRFLREEKNLDAAQNLIDSHLTHIQVLEDDLKARPSLLAGVSTSKANSAAPSEHVVFIIHGHDEANRLRLEKMLRDRWKLKTILLQDKPGKSRTIIEKFEEEAPVSTFAFALMTPDDFVEAKSGEYLQARPNVIFELGWFYRHLGRDKTCILFKRGTKIHSDLEGIERIEFHGSVEEVVADIQDELIAAGVISSPESS